MDYVTKFKPNIDDMLKLNRVRLTYRPTDPLPSLHFCAPIFDKRYADILGHAVWIKGARSYVFQNECRGPKITVEVLIGTLLNSTLWNGDHL